MIIYTLTGIVLMWSVFAVLMARAGEGDRLYTVTSEAWEAEQWLF